MKFFYYIKNDKNYHQDHFQKLDVQSLQSF